MTSLDLMVMGVGEEDVDIGDREYGDGSSGETLETHSVQIVYNKEL